MGIVYRAVDVKLEREVALKVLPPELVADPERRRRFVDEAKAAARLERPYIATVYEIDEADGVTSPQHTSRSVRLTNSEAVLCADRGGKSRET